jgi:hypothetical protein
MEKFKRNEWDKAICSLALCYPNVDIVKVNEQNPVDMGQLYMRLNDSFEYLNHELNAHGFKDYIRRFMKTKQTQL